MKTFIKQLGLAVLVLSAQSWAAPSCPEYSEVCETLNQQMQSYYGIRADNNYGRIVDFYRVDANRWRHAAKTEPRLPRPHRTAVLGSSDIEQDFLRGQYYLHLSKANKWRVLQATFPEIMLSQLTTSKTEKAVKARVAFFEALDSDELRVGYMTLTPAHRAEAQLKGKNAAAFINQYRGEYEVSAYTIDFEDILDHFKPVTAEPLLFPKHGSEVLFKKP